MHDYHGSSRGRVCILMGLYNGAAHLEAQLQSFADQSLTAWDLVAGDDGSVDDGPEILRRFAETRDGAGHCISLVPGPRNGFAANFLTLIAHAPTQASWLALSDQDDVWLPDHLARGVAALEALPKETPALYCSRTWVVDEDLGNRRLSAQFPRPPGFRNALVQNIAAGNTILLNRAAADLARAAAAEAAETPGPASHDWWLYQLITGVGGTVLHDPEPALLYRQHAENQIGANDGWRARMTRMTMILKGRYAAWNAANIATLEASAHRLTAENQALLERFAALRRENLPARLRRFASLGLYRQSRLAQAALWLAVGLGRI